MNMKNETVNLFSTVQQKSETLKFNTQRFNKKMIDIYDCLYLVASHGY